MKKLLLLALIACGPGDTVIMLDASGNWITCDPVPRSVCEAAYLIAETHCGRQEVCFNSYPENCRESVIHSLCNENNCEGYYPTDSMKRLQDCIAWYNSTACTGPTPGECKLY